MTTEKKDIVKLTDKVAVVATDKDKFHNPGQKYYVHPKQVAYLQSKGLVENSAKK